MEKQTNYDSSDANTKNWLEPLRRHSWEMELLLTGFVLIGLLQIPQALEFFLDMLWIKIEGGGVFKSLIIALPIRVLLVGVRIMTINLVLLLLLRGFWIGMIGLSSAFPKGIDHQKLSFSERFANYLKQKTIDSEHIIIRLDNICSSIFALSFLIFFITISMGLFVFQFQVFNSLGQWAGKMTSEGSIFQTLLNISFSVVMLFYFLSGVLKLIDFLSVGALKRIRKKWFAKPYFFVSRFISFVTLAFLYRPVYYYLVSNFPKRVIRIVLAIYMFITVGMFFDFAFNSHIYYPQSNFSHYNLIPNYYENIRPDDYKNRIITSPMIQSDVIKGNYVKLFIPYDVAVHKILKSQCPDLKPISQSFRAKIVDTGYSLDASDVKNSLSCFSELYSVAIDDSVYSDLKMFFHEHPNNNEKGVMIYIPVKHIQSGYHTLEIMEADEKTDMIHLWKD